MEAHDLIALLTAIAVLISAVTGFLAVLSRSRLKRIETSLDKEET
jgi:hypothetical protein